MEVTAAILFPRLIILKTEKEDHLSVVSKNLQECKVLMKGHPSSREKEKTLLTGEGLL